MSANPVNKPVWQGFFMVISVIALKQFYSVATTSQLQWLLYPLVLLLELFSDLSFAWSSAHEWYDDRYRISIVKACAGINFFTISFIGYSWQWRQRRWCLRLLLRLLILAWLTTLTANTLRILLCVYGQSTLIRLGLSEADSHRLLGIVVYFAILWLQVARLQWQHLNRTALLSLAIYLSITLCIPLVRAYLWGIPVSMGAHIVWVIGLPGLLILTYLLGRAIVIAILSWLAWDAARISNINPLQIMTTDNKF